MVSGRDLRHRHGLLLIAATAAIVRLAIGGVIPLTEDEAYYRLWAQHLQFGYYDHPPMIAWWIRAGQLIAGDRALGVRLLPALATGLTTWLIGDLARRLGGDARTAARAAIWYNATFTLAIGGILAIPDAPAALFWTLTVWCLAHTRRSERLGWWLAAGAAGGLTLLSKYSGLFLAPGVLLWLLASAEGRAALRRPGPWLAGLLAALIFLPNLVWNATHGWETFMRQYGRVSPHGLHPSFLLELLATQVLLLNPVIAVYAVRGVGQAWREPKDEGGPRLALPLLTAAPFAAYLVLHSLHDRVQGHWPVPLFSALAICAAFAAEKALTAGRSRLAVRAAPGLGFGLAGAVLLYLALPVQGFGASDPSSAIRGWPQLAAEVERLRLAQGAAWVGADSYGVLAQLDAQHRIRAPMLEIIERDRYRKDAPRPDFTRPGLVVDLERRLKPAQLSQCFATVEPVARLTRGADQGKNGRYVAYRVTGLRHDVWMTGCPD
jgi:4-amino-4-deoxy-L-arabinose transferase-like glycosyltransferase